MRGRGIGALSALGVCGLVLAIAIAPARADVTVKVRVDPPRVGVNEAADLAVEVQGVQSSAAPEIADAGGATVQYRGPASQVSIVNGRMSASVTHHFSVMATKPGRYTIGPIGVTADGKRHEAGTTTLEVTAGPPGSAAGGASDRQLRLELTTPRTTVYLNERIPLRLKLMVGNVRVSDLQYPTIAGDGFAVEKFGGEPDQRQERTAEGVFQVLDFATVLTPLRSGPMTVGPAHMDLMMVVRGRGGRGFGGFFGDQFFNEQRKLQLASDPLVLNVLPLPEENKPADFSGAVGTFDFDVKAAPLELTAGDPVTVTMTIRGSGSLESVSPPTIAAAPGLRVYPPQQTSSGTRAATDANVQERVYEQVVIPENAGATTLPALRFSFFDPAKGAYQTIPRAAIPLVVDPRPAGQAPSQVVGAAPAVPRAAPEPEALGHDLVFIKDAPGTLRPVGARLYRSPVFWAAQALPVLAWFAIVVIDRRRQRLHGDAGYARFTRAGREARRALGEARTALRPGNQMVFYDAVARALAEYLAAKLQLPPGAVSAESVADEMRRRGVASPLADQVRDFFATCEQVRFAPTNGDADMQRILDQGDAIVRALERERRIGAPVAALLTLAMGCALAGGAVAADTEETPQALFFRGNALYGDERYADAIAAYEKALSAGRESGNLHFNLGNAYFKTGDVGRAILAYERARRLAPRDPDLHANLGYAREKSGDVDATPLWTRLLLPLAARASSDELLVGASLCFFLLVTALGVARLVPRAARAGRGIAAVLALGLALFATSAGYRIATVDAPTFAVVLAGNDGDVRFEPSTTGTTHFETKPGAVLRILAEREGWAQVARPDGKRGWIARAAIALI